MPTFCPAPAYGGASAIPETSRLRHVVFVDRSSPRRRALDLRPVCDPIEGAGLPAGETSCEEESFIAWLFAKAGLDGRQYGAQTLNRRMAACLRGLRAT